MYIDRGVSETLTRVRADVTTIHQCRGGDFGGGRRGGMGGARAGHQRGGGRGVRGAGGGHVHERYPLALRPRQPAVKPSRRQPMAGEGQGRERGWSQVSEQACRFSRCRHEKHRHPSYSLAHCRILHSPHSCPAPPRHPQTLAHRSQPSHATRHRWHSPHFAHASAPDAHSHCTNAAPAQARLSPCSSEPPSAAAAAAIASRTTPALSSLPLASGT